MDNQDTQITEADIAALTSVFYAQVRKDEFLGPIFNKVIGQSDAQWEPHIARINDFWSGIFLKTSRFDGNPMSKHAGLPDIVPEHFTKWLALFEEAAAKTLPPVKQEQFVRTAQRIAKSLQMGLAFHNSSNDITPNPFAKFGVRMSGF